MKKLTLSIFAITTVGISYTTYAQQNNKKSDSSHTNVRMDSMKQAEQISKESVEAAEATNHLRWGIKTTIENDADHKTESVSDLMALSNFPLSEIKDRDARYASARIPIKVGSDNLKEGDIITIDDCYIQMIKEESDKDYHIEINEKVGNKTKCMIIEIPEGDLVEGGQEMGSKFDKLRQMVSSYLGDGKLLSTPVHVKVTGQLMYDDDHVEAADPSGGRGSKKDDGMKPTNLWELHPVIDIKFL